MSRAQVPLSILDLSPIVEGGDAAAALRNTLDLARHAERWGLFGAQLAATLGLPYAFASHFAPAHMMQAIASYRSLFRPSEPLARPYVMLGVNVFAADTEGEARRLMTSVQQAFVSLRTGRPGLLPPPVDDYERGLGPMERAILDHALSCSFVGTPDEVAKGLDAFVARTGADELMVVSQIFDHSARLRSYDLVAPGPPALAR